MAAAKDSLKWLSDPRLFGIALIFALAAGGWSWMLLGVAAHSGSAASADFGPGMALLGFDNISAALVWCARALGVPSNEMYGTGPAAMAIAFSMWAAMVCGMMLPTAAPMVTTYGEIAETAIRGDKKIASTAYLIAGYATVWIGYSAIVTILQGLLYESGALRESLTPAAPWLGAAVLLIAGAYQFSAMKIACLSKCRLPFNFFFANWRDTAGGVFGLGIRQGLICLGCCWALMLVMFAVGLMNLVWMALLGSLMLLEKIISRPDPLRKLTGFGLIVWGLALIGIAAV